MIERFYLEEPSIERKYDAIDYINEHINYNSNINGSRSLYKYLNNYEEWLNKLQDDYASSLTETTVPSRTYFLIRENDNKIIGMINIRLKLNEKLKKFGGNIGYGIRPLERNKGYNKINLYLGLKICDKYGIDRIYLDAALDNPASWKTMEALDGKRLRTYYNEEVNCDIVNYTINVKKSLEENKFYEDYVVDRGRHI